MAPDLQREARQRIALNARRQREGRGWTQALAAEKVGCSLQAMQRLEGAAATFTVDFLVKVAAVFDLDVRDLLSPAGPWVRRDPGRPPRARPAPPGARPKRRRTRRVKR